jgi:hypothetical protein|tara:strand:- start:1382 stop:1828 length:447 start_codon:yes stop_codon:yes gene_type:complete
MEKDLQLMSLPSLVSEPQNQPSMKDIAQEVIKRQVARKVMERVGINAAQASGIGSLLGIGGAVFGPLGAVSALAGRSLGISDFLSNKRAQKEARRQRLSDPQGDVVTYPVGIMSMQPTAQDEARGSGGGGGAGNYGMPGRAASSYEDL